MLRFTSKCSLLLLAVVPRWAYAEFECGGNDGNYLMDPAECRVEEVNRVFGAELDYCYSSVTSSDLNYVSDVDARALNAGAAVRLGGSLRCL